MPSKLAWCLECGNLLRKTRESYSVKELAIRNKKNYWAEKIRRREQK